MRELTEHEIELISHGQLLNPPAVVSRDKD